MIRSAREDDLSGVLAQMRRYYAADGYPFDEAPARRAASGLIADRSLGRLWVVEEDGAVVGYLVLTFGYSLECGGRDAFVDEVVVDEAFRGRGHGTELLRLAEAECRAEGVRAVHLEVERGKEATIGLYRRLGFEDRDRLLLTRRLS
jgi:ribosomal protein S18 acetylase RimI-like enzyme